MPAVAEYLGSLQSERGASRNTLAAYRRDLDDFQRFLRGHRLTPTRVTAEHVVSWLEGLRGRGLAPSSIARRLSALRGFYRHLVREGEPLATVMARDVEGIAAGRRAMEEAIRIDEEADYPLPLISHRVTIDGAVPYESSDTPVEVATQP